MATYNLRRFAHADGLKAIAREHLLALLDPQKHHIIACFCHKYNIKRFFVVSCGI